MKVTSTFPGHLQIAAAIFALTASANVALAQTMQHDFGVQASTPAGPTAYAGTNGVGVRYGNRVNGSIGTGNGASVGIGGCVSAYPWVIPHPAALGSRAGGEVCAYVTPNGLETTVAPGVRLPNGATVNAYYTNTYNPLGGASQQQTAQPAPGPSYQPAPQPSAAEMMARRDAELAMRREIAQHAYNPPADLIAPYTAAPRQTPQQVPVQQAAPSGGMTQEQFRASVDQSMQQFYQAASRQGQATSAAPPAPPERPVNNDSRPAQHVTFDDNAPRRSAPPEAQPQPRVPQVQQRSPGARAETAALNLPF